MDDEQMVEGFRQRLGETMRWCSQRPCESAIAEQFRSPALQPVLRSDGDLEHWNTAVERNEVVETLIRERARLLASETGVTGVESTGRIVAYAPDQSLDDGVACVASHGYFDDFNNPGSDAWICYVMQPSTAQVRTWEAPYPSYLLGWLPAWLVPHVENAIDANPEGCLAWANMLEDPFIAALRRADLLT